jgi:hypothetical protein
MTALRRDRQSARRWARKVLPCSVVVIVVGSLGAYLYRGVQQARNAALSSATT